MLSNREVSNKTYIIPNILYRKFNISPIFISLNLTKITNKIIIKKKEQQDFDMFFETQSTNLS